MRQGTSRNQPLDILRGIAILLVLGYHYSYVRLWGRAGWTGVDLFFVLSGFLISGLLFKEYKRSGGIDAVRFLIRRGFKIYPAFYLLMAVTGGYWLFSYGRLPGKIFSDLFFLQDYYPPVWAHGWSLGVEEQFYWLLPLLLLLMIAKSRNKENPFGGIPWTFAALAVGCLGLRTFAVLQGAPLRAIQCPAHLRIDSLFAGVAIGYYRHFHPEGFARVARRPLWLPGLALLIPAFLFPLGAALTDSIGYTLLYLGFGSILIWAVDRRASGAAWARGLAWTGRYSYSIYLWHLPLLDAFFGGPVDLVRFLLFLATAILFGAAMSRLIEIPFLKLRDRWFPPKNVLPPDIAVTDRFVAACRVALNQ